MTEFAVFAVICGNDRIPYRLRCINSLETFLPDIPFSVQNDTFHEGMAANVQHGFELFLKTDADYCLWVEEDFVLLRPLPLDHAVNVLDYHPHLAQMLFQRQPLAPGEVAAGSVIGGMPNAAPRGESSAPRTFWFEHTHIFSLNPCLIPRRVIELGWPAGPLGVGNETGMTNKLLAMGYTFGVWDGQYVEHIGEMRGPGWQL